MKRVIRCAACFALMLMLISGCKAEIQRGNGKPEIVATMFPQYSLAKYIAGDKADVKMLMKPGSEVHVFEPSPKDIAALQRADAVLYSGDDMEPWAAKMISGTDIEADRVCDVSRGITLDEVSHDDSVEHAEYVHTRQDAHYWTSPANAIKMADTIAEKLVSIDEGSAQVYRTNADRLKQELKALDKELSEVVENGKRKEIIFGGRFAMHYFIKEYGLECRSAYDSCGEESEPSARRIMDLIEEINQKNIRVVYYEELSNHKIADSIAEQAGVKTLLLHSCHNISADDFEKGVSYLDIMRNNALNLKEGLN